MVHTLDLPKRNQTSDGEILDIATQEQRVVMTKDADFVESHIVTGRPEKLILLSTGNTSNAALEAIILPALPQIITSLTTSSYIELTRTKLIIHR